MDSRATLHVIAGVRQAHNYTYSAQQNTLTSQDSINKGLRIGRQVRPSIADSSQHMTAELTPLKPRVFFGTQLAEASETSSILDSKRELNDTYVDRSRLISARRNVILPSLAGPQRPKNTSPEVKIASVDRKAEKLPRLEESKFKIMRHKRGESSPNLVGEGRLTNINSLSIDHRSNFSAMAGLKLKELAPQVDTESETETVHKWRSVPPKRETPVAAGDEKMLNYLLDSVSNKYMAHLGTVGYLQRLIKQNKARIAEFEGTLKKLKTHIVQAQPKVQTTTSTNQIPNHWKRINPKPAMRSASQSSRFLELTSSRVKSNKKPDSSVEPPVKNWDALIEHEKNNLVATRDLYLLQEEIILRLLEDNQYLDNIYGEYLDGLVENSNIQVLSQPMGELSPIYGQPGTITANDQERIDSMQEFIPKAPVIPRTRSEKGTKFENKWVEPLKGSQIAGRSGPVQTLKPRDDVSMASASDSSSSEPIVLNPTPVQQPTPVPTVNLTETTMPNLIVRHAVSTLKIESSAVDRDSKTKLLRRDGSLAEDPNLKANSSSNFTFLKQESPHHLKESMKSKSGGELQPTFNFAGSRNIEVKNSGIKTSENMIPPPDEHQEEETSSEDSLLSAGIQDHAEPKNKPVILTPELKDRDSQLKNSAFDQPNKKPVVMQSPIIMIPKYQGPADMSEKFPKLAELFKAIESKKPEPAFLTVQAQKAPIQTVNQPTASESTGQATGPDNKPPEPGSIVEARKTEQNPAKEATPALANDSGHRAMSKETLAILQRLYNPTASLSPLGRWGMANSIQPAASKPTLTSVMAQVGESSASAGPNTEPPSTLLPDASQPQPKGVVSQLALPKMKDMVIPEEKGKKAFEDLFGRISAKSINEHSEQAKSGGNTGRHIEQRNSSQRSFMPQGAPGTPAKPSFMKVLSLFKGQSVKQPSDEQSQPDVRELDPKGQNQIVHDRIKALRVSSNYPMQVKHSPADLFNSKDQAVQPAARIAILPTTFYKKEDTFHVRVKPKIVANVIPPDASSPKKVDPKPK